MERRNETLEGISIVIPTRNRVEYVQRLFTSLYNELKTFDGPAEVIIIDSSDSNNSKLIAAMCEKYGYNFRFLGGSISESRNYGVRVAKYPIVLFIDSDCEVVPGILREHLQSYAGEEIGGVLGSTNFVGKRNWVWRAIEKTPFLTAFSFAKRMDYTLWGPCTNISFRKEVIEKIGGFETKFPFDRSGEDVDVGLRVNELGYKIRCNPNAVVNHACETWCNFWDFCKKIFRWGRTDFHILKKHPYLSCIDFPKFSTILLFVFIFVIIFRLIGFDWRIAEVLLNWILCVPLTEAFFKSYTSKFRDFLSNYLSFWLVLIFELGTIFESLINGSLLMLYGKIVYGKGQLIFEWNHKVTRCWSYAITSIMFLFALLLSC
jgi:glycosyltransferase involved in cell wall biosynthesis